MAKLLENTFRHINIALVNELAVLARTSGSTSGRSSTRRPRKPFGFMLLLPWDPVSAGTASRSTRCTSPGGLKSAFGRRRPRSSTWPVTLNAGMPLYVVNGVQDLFNERERSLQGARGSCCSGSPTSPTSATCAIAGGRASSRQLLRRWAREVRAVEPYTRRPRPDVPDGARTRST